MDIQLILSGLVPVLCFGVSFGTTLPPADPSCYCLGEPYLESAEPFMHDDCTYCVNCGEVQQADCIDSCVNPEPEVDSDGICCPICPDGPNCETEGVIIPHGDQMVVGDQLCECEPLILSSYNPKTSVICYPLPPAY
ncbi:hypothetical protein LOTGIDRAFT_232630 [Lottia gigantea]|uniref:VWFC domain-containing protein n=1 Tax=Lottia gigantea TaxID=225164 RepID=V4BX02_LOTGI|nr:hypothetical protein LOTGIDRAFT_232630 [Lottia gigantea]ESO93579.1 hypothetical protein LOTGIDRAFT_232630 [Lottia gigantea]